MLTDNHPEPTGWDSLVGDPWSQPYGLPYFRGQYVSVSCGRLGPSYWHEHTYPVMRLIFTFDHAVGAIETTQGDSYRFLSALLAPHHVFIVPAGLEMTLDWLKRADVVILYDEANLSAEYEWFLTDVIRKDLRCLARSDDHLTCLIELFRTVLSERDLPKYESIGGIGTALACRILQKCFTHVEHGPRPQPVFPEEKTRELAEYIEAHLSDNITVEDLADHCGLSRDHFARRWKASFHMSPKQFVLKRKMEAVRRLLDVGTLNVSEAGREVGFHDASHLNRCFRKFFKCSPKTYAMKALRAGLSK